MSAVLAHRQRHREEFARQGVTLTLTAYFAQAAVTAIRAVPEANSRWMDAALEIYDTIHLGIATATEAGLVVPVLQQVESLDLLETARRLEPLVQRARDGALTPADVRGGTFTLSNHGVSGSLLAAPIIIPQPQSAILGLGKLEKRAVVIEKDGGGRDRRPLVLLCHIDDRPPCDGRQPREPFPAGVHRAPLRLERLSGR